MSTDLSVPEQVYFGTSHRTILGPYHPDEWDSHERAKLALGSSEERAVYRVAASSMEEARTRLLAALTRDKKPS